MSTNNNNDNNNNKLTYTTTYISELCDALRDDMCQHVSSLERQQTRVLIKVANIPHQSEDTLQFF